jgi:hypothetical protein
MTALSTHGNHHEELENQDDNCLFHNLIIF